MRNLFFVAICLSVIVVAACQKEANDSAQTQFKVLLTDNPIDAQQVNVDIQEVRVNLRDDSSGWTRLATVAGVYNLLDLQNGVDTVLAAGTIPTGQLKEIRLVLGSNNTIMVDSVIYPLTIPSGSESGLKLKINKSLTAGIDSILIDFDAALSIHQTGTGDYKLKPVLKIK